MVSSSGAAAPPSSQSQPPQKSSDESMKIMPDVVRLREIVDKYSQTKDDSLFQVLSSFGRLHPTSFSINLCKILEMQPSNQLRAEAVHFLFLTLLEGDKPTNVLMDVREPLLCSLMMENSDPLFHPLCVLNCRVAGRLYSPSNGSWSDLIRYFIASLSSYSILCRKKALLLLSEFPPTISREKIFSQNFNMIFSKVTQLIHSDTVELNEICYKAGISLIVLSREFHREDVIEILLPSLLNIIANHDVTDSNFVTKLKDLCLLKFSDGYMFSGKQVEALFWCMIRVVEIEDASDDVRCEAVNVIKEVYDETMMENMIRWVSQRDMERLVAVSVSMMSCVIDGPCSFDVNDDGAGLTKSFYLGRFLLDTLCFDGDDSAFFPTVVNMLTTDYAFDNHWQIRHATLHAVATIAMSLGKSDFKKLSILALKSLDDPNHRVVAAAVNAIRHLSECRKLVMHTQFDKKFMERLVPLSKYYPCTCVQSSALIAIKVLDKHFLPDIKYGQDSNIANQKNRLTDILDEMEMKLNSRKSCLSISNRKVLTAQEIIEILKSKPELKQAED